MVRMWTTTAVVCVACALAMMALAATAQSTWRLITPDEEARDDAAPHLAEPPDLGAFPTIELVRPDISREIRNPVTIEVRFGPGPGEVIDMRTFNATYGWLGIDITRRLLDHATITANGLMAADVELPLGGHRVTLSIADTSGNSSSRTFRLSVGR
jgi:hypothetical protein